MRSPRPRWSGPTRGSRGLVAPIALCLSLLGGAAVAPQSAAAQRSPAESAADKRRLAGAASAAMALAGLIIGIRRYRTRSRLPREDRKFGDYRGPKK